jgi:hypothetical protein
METIGLHDWQQAGLAVVAARPCRRQCRQVHAIKEHLNNRRMARAQAHTRTGLWVISLFILLLLSVTHAHAQTLAHMNAEAHADLARANAGNGEKFMDRK